MTCLHLSQPLLTTRVGYLTTEVPLVSKVREQWLQEAQGVERPNHQKLTDSILAASTLCTALKNIFAGLHKSKGTLGLLTPSLPRAPKQLAQSLLVTL